MGTASFHVGKYGRNRGSGAGTVVSSDVRVSGAYITTASATNLEDSTATDIIMAVGEILQIYCDEAMRIRFGGVAATASTGLYIPAVSQVEIECDDAGLVSIIDVA